MRNRFGIFVDSEESVRNTALSDLLIQGDEFEILASIDLEQPPAVIIVDKGSKTGKCIEKRLKDYRLKLKHCVLILLVNYYSQMEEVENYSDSFDDLVREPFGICDLITMIRKHVYNRQWLAAKPFKIGNLLFAVSDQYVMRDEDGNSVSLSSLEAQVLHHLYSARNQYVSRNVLLKDVWGYEPSVNTTTVQSHIHRIRNKLSHLQPGKEFIFTKGDGYRLAEIEPPENSL